MEEVDRALRAIGRLNPEEWREYALDEQRRAAGELTGLMHLIQSACMDADMLIRDHEWNEGHQHYLKLKDDKERLEKAHIRCQKELSGLQSLMKGP